MFFVIFCFKQKTAYEMRISDWSSDVCSSDLYGFMGSGEDPIMLTRFAPSPTGELHLGHAYSAVLAHDAARGADGRFMSRIDDIDGSRSRADYVAASLAAPNWLGLYWDGEPVRPSDLLRADSAALQRLGYGAP